MSDAAVSWQEPNLLRVSGEVDFVTAASVRSQGEALIERAPDAFVVDLEGLSSTHSVALSVLMRWLAVARRHNKDCRIERIPGKLLDVARVSGLDQVLPLSGAEPAATV